MTSIGLNAPCNSVKFDAYYTFAEEFIGILLGYHIWILEFVEPVQRFPLSYIWPYLVDLREEYKWIAGLSLNFRAATSLNESPHDMKSTTHEIHIVQ